MPREKIPANARIFVLQPTFARAACKPPRGADSAVALMDGVALVVLLVRLLLALRVLQRGNSGSTKSLLGAVSACMKATRSSLSCLVSAMCFMSGDRLVFTSPP